MNGAQKKVCASSTADTGHITPFGFKLQSKIIYVIF